MPSTDSRPRTRLATVVTGLLAASAIGIAAAPSASAAEVFRERFTSESAQAYTDSTSADGCTYTSTSVGAGTTSDATSVMYYSTYSINKCTGQGYTVYGDAPTQTFTFDRNLVHAVATVPLSDGTQIYLDLTWQGTGKAERGALTSRDVLPGKFVQPYSNRGTFQQATVTGTLSFENAYISASKGSVMTVTIDIP